MSWVVALQDAFVPEFEALSEEVQDGLAALLVLLEHSGPHLGRPRVDTLKGSRHANMKELRLHAGDGVWRFAFAFDPERRAIVLCGGDKSGGGEKRFYKKLIIKADDRFDTHLESLKRGQSPGKERKNEDP